MCLAAEVGEGNINQLWVSPNLCVSRSAVTPSLPLPLSGNLTPVRTVKNWESCQTAGSAQGKEEMPGACAVNGTVGFGAGKLPSNYSRVFITSGSFFSSGSDEPFRNGKLWKANPVCQLSSAQIAMGMATAARLHPDTLLLSSAC